MSLAHSPSIITNGLVLCLDAANLKGYDKFENLLTNSNISSVNWNPNSSPVLTNNASTSPDGTINATQIAASAAAGSGIFRTISLTSGTVYTYSVFVKAVSGSNTIYFGTDIGTDSRITVNTSTGVASLNFGSPTNITSTSYPNGWYRVSFTFTASATATHSFVIYNLTANANTWLAWGAQLERGSSASPYYPTTGTAKNRGTTLIDLTGRGNTGTLTNGPTYSGANGGSIVLDGVDDYISTGLVLPSPSTTPTTFDLLFKYNSSNTSRGLIGASNYTVSGFSVGFIGQSQMRNTYNASGLQFENNWNYDSSVISNGTFVFDGRNISVYRNSSFIQTFTASFDVVANGNGIQIGRNLQGGWGASQVDVYAVKIYNKALSAAEIQQNFNATRRRFGI
jgi:hypothetical protein